jgi:alpha-tubulin suppressor-like RCC1 family protein
MRRRIPWCWQLLVLLQLTACGGGGDPPTLQAAVGRPAGLQLASGQTLEADLVIDQGTPGQGSVSVPLTGDGSIIGLRVTGLQLGGHSVVIDYYVDDPRWGKVLVASAEGSVDVTDGSETIDFTGMTPRYVHDEDGVTTLQKLLIGVDPARRLAHFGVVSTGLSHSCAIRDNATLWCWGDNRYGQLGSEVNAGTPRANTTPRRVEGQWATVSSGDDHTCAIREDGTLWCWGANKDGQLGRAAGVGTENAHPDVVQVGDAIDWVDVSAGGGHTCGVRADHSLWCWGANGFGQLGIAGGGSTTVPTQVGGNRWVEVAAGADHTCALGTDSHIWCWGSNAHGELGNSINAGTGASNLDPALVGRQDPAGISGSPESDPARLAGSWASISAKGFQTCAVRVDHTLWCWGNNRDGQLGRTDNIGTDLPNSVPLQLGDLGLGWTRVSEGRALGCALADGGSLWCWGGGLGEVGRIVDVDARRFVPAQGNDGWATASAGGGHVCAIRTNRTLWCWGRNESGQLGSDSALTPMATPVKLSG